MFWHDSGEKAACRTESGRGIVENIKYNILQNPGLKRQASGVAGHWAASCWGWVKTVIILMSMTVSLAKYRGWKQRRLLWYRGVKIHWYCLYSSKRLKALFNTVMFLGNLAIRYNISYILYRKIWIINTYWRCRVGMPGDSWPRRSPDCRECRTWVSA